MKLSVIVPCWNGADTIGHQLAALAQQRVDFEWEVVVVDNGSTDDSVAQARRFEGLVPNLRIVHAADRQGVAYVRNVGAREARGEWLAWCDADDAVGGRWLAAMAEALEAHPVVASRFEGSLLNATSPARPLGQQRRIETLWYSPFLPHAGGSGLGIRKRVHQEIGGFDESLDRLEDTDYSIRLQLAGYPIHFAPNAVLHVRYRATRKGMFRQAREWARANTHLYRRYSHRREPARAAWRTYAQGLWRLAGSLGKLRSGRNRTALIWGTGWHLGLIEGALRHRVAPIAGNR